MPDAPTRFERVANWFDGLRKVLVAAGVGAIVVIVLAAIVRELAMGGIAIDPVVVKATDAPDAPMPELAAQQIARQLDRIQRSGVQEWRRLHVDDGVRPVDLQIPGAPLSVRNAAREVVALFGLAPVTLRSALTRRGDGKYAAVMSLAGDHGSMANCPTEGDDTLDAIYECIAVSAIAFIDPKTAASYMFQREEAECKELDAGLADMPDLHREQHRINNRRDRCSFRKTQKLIAKMMSSTNKADLRWVPYIFGQIHMARAKALVGAGLQQQLSEIDQAIGRFRDSQRQMQDSPTAVAVLMKAFLLKGIIIHQTTPPMEWVDDPTSLLQKRLDIADMTFAEAAEQLQQLPKARSPSLDALVSRLEGLLIYRQWMIDAHRRTKSGRITVADDKAELAELARAAARYAAAEAKVPASASELLDWGNILRASGKFEEANVKYRRAIDLDPSNADAALNIVITYIDRFERNSGTPDTGHLLVALGSLSDYLAWLSDGGPYSSLLSKVQSLLGDVGHGQAFDECLRNTRTTPALSEAKVGKWKDAAPFKFCVDGAIDGIMKVGIQSADVTKASR
ncbi:MAG TPA: tetratricopeptide repeat protein [Reyranella sp.]|nr:tetratricopeptide repeat protein [Reyranella sp.]